LILGYETIPCKSQGRRGIEGAGIVCRYKGQQDANSNLQVGGLFMVSVNSRNIRIFQQDIRRHHRATSETPVVGKLQTSGRRSHQSNKHIFIDFL